MGIPGRAADSLSGPGGGRLEDSGPSPVKNGEKAHSPAAEAAGRAAGGVPRGAPVLSSIPVASLAAALKLPAGPWSASILSFAKFFSLPLDGNFLAAIRQKVLKAEALDHAGTPESVAAGGIGAEERREALSLAALAASAKGVELSPEALAEFARALRGRDSPERAEPDSCPDSSPESGHESGGNHETEPGPEFGTDKQNPGEDSGAGRGREEARALRKKLLTAQSPLLRLLNGLPGKDGKRWIALPFSTDDGFEGCLRILLRPQAAAYRVERMGLDIRRRGKNTGAGEPAWSFILRADGAETGEPGAANPRETPLLEVFCRPAPGPAGTLERELAALLGLPPDSVRVRDKPFPANTAAFAAAFAEDSRDRIIPSLS